jgi:flagellin-specific chaperone FliS
MNDVSFQEGRPDRPGPPSGTTPGPADEPDEAESAEPDPILGLLFDAALRSLDRARRALTHDGASVSSMGLAELVRARRTIDELRTLARVQPLDGAGDDTVETLVNLYEFCSDRLSQAASTRNPDLITAVEDVLVELRDAFVG